MKIVLIGYGKMGKEIEQIALQRGHEVVLKAGSSSMEVLSKEALAAADVAIEFTRPEIAASNIQRCFDAGLPVVVGTTGWLEDLPKIEKKCKEQNQSLFYASNFSIGVNLFFKLNAYLAKLMNQHKEYRVEMEEIHHVHKLDAPSGTAISLANQLLEHLDHKTAWVNEATSEGPLLPIVSRREGEVPGTHSITYTSDVDELSIVHKAYNRKGFALGAVIAAEWLPGKKGIFGMNDLLTEKNELLN